ncbi:tetratricopeptide repeat-containing glycosyltransferase family 2 protein [Paenibacillus flagellatus]|uniref:Glycosyltransferase 2-like domain-containing protein n=1 Tax=Paenibacillus flagellatus TaxID=2211139 RepID=A0A2V5KBG0_9BACL|nr:glycosyltransferase family 2 protein [Paenibacillus flagellatus]PYI56282.1 hypothetical protein DLM86_04670 [Paenibacillus flagellatus]
MHNPTAERRYSSIIEPLQERRFREAERAAMDEIGRSPLVPQPWVLLGEALLHQGFGRAAKRAFDRAWLLDPQATWVARVDGLLKRAPDGPARPDVERLLECRRPTVTIGIIARDEERTIARCLASVQGAADAVVLVDCGSKDRTAEIAASYPDVTIVPAEWQDDFAALRNAGLAHMKTDWVLWVDADEALHPDDRPAVREVAGLYDELEIPPILHVWQINSIAGATQHEFAQTRMFPLRFGLRYHGRVHEQVGPEGGLYDGHSYRKPVRIRLLHDGYEPDVVKRKDKIKRNLRLLERMVAEQPDDPGWWLFYARESWADGREEQALHALRQAEEKAAGEPRFGRLPDVHTMRAKLHASRNELDEAERAAAKALAVDDTFPDAKFWMAAIKLRQAHRLQREAEALLRESKEAMASYRGVVSPDAEIARWKADLSLADIARSVGKFADAAYMYERLAELNPDVAHIRKPLARTKEQLAKLDAWRASRRHGAGEAP